MNKKQKKLTKVNNYLDYAGTSLVIVLALLAIGVLTLMASHSH